jgi:hypothetical protein
MPAKKYTEDETKTLKEAAVCMERLTYEIMLEHFKREIKKRPNELNKNIYSLIANKENWELIRDFQAQNRLEKRYVRK